jgi:hypothetical protein
MCIRLIYKTPIIISKIINVYKINIQNSYNNIKNN